MLRALPRSQPAIENDDSRGSDPLSSTLIDSTTPESLRSSGTIAIPAVIAAAGWLRLTCLPRTTTSPAVVCRAPKIASSSSVRPAPTSPARPTISPARTVNDTGSAAPST